MAYGVVVLGTRPGTEYIGGTQTRPVVIVEARSTPSAIYFECMVPQKGFAANLARAAALGYADIYETANALPHVAGVFWSEGPNAVDELETRITFVVESTSGNSEAPLTVPILQLGPHLHEAQIEALHAELDATEG